MRFGVSLDQIQRMTLAMHVADQLTQTITASKSVACVGLDPRPHLIPPTLAALCVSQHGDTREAVAAAFKQFNFKILDAIAGHCAAVKPQVACYEAYGWQGMQALEESIAYARKLGIPVIVDGKRNDIGSTATHYHEAWLGQAAGLHKKPVAAVNAEWLTVNGYLGSDGITPFLDDDNQHGIFVLVKTSNPSSGELQGKACEGSTVMEQMASLVEHWGKDRVGSSGLHTVGAVVGATYPDEAKQLRRLMPGSIFLVPGYGAQGGGAADALAGIRDDGQGVLVNSSRAINGAWQADGWADDDWAAAARHALDEMNADLNQHL